MKVAVEISFHNFLFELSLLVHSFLFELSLLACSSELLQRALVLRICILSCEINRKSLQFHFCIRSFMVYSLVVVCVCVFHKSCIQIAFLYLKTWKFLHQFHLYQIDLFNFYLIHYLYLISIPWCTFIITKFPIVFEILNNLSRVCPQV